MMNDRSNHPYPLAAAAADMMAMVTMAASVHQSPTMQATSTTTTKPPAAAAAAAATTTTTAAAAAAAEEIRTIPFLRRLVDMLTENPIAISFEPGRRQPALNKSSNNNAPPLLLGRIVVHDRATVESEILPRYFNHCSFASLRRQLNYFNFVREGKGRQKGAAYLNEDVVDLQDILRLRRRPATSNGSIKSSKAIAATMAAAAAAKTTVDSVFASVSSPLTASKKVRKVSSSKSGKVTSSSKKTKPSLMKLAAAPSIQVAAVSPFNSPVHSPTTPKRTLATQESVKQILHHTPELRLSLDLTVPTATTTTTSNIHDASALFKAGLRHVSTAGGGVDTPVRIKHDHHHHHNYGCSTSSSASSPPPPLVHWSRPFDGTYHGFAMKTTTAATTDYPLSPLSMSSMVSTDNGSSGSSSDDDEEVQEVLAGCQLLLTLAQGRTFSS